jgi:hypothetical protein
MADQENLGEGYKPPPGAVVERGFQGLTGKENPRLFRQGKTTPSNYPCKSRMPEGFSERFCVSHYRVPILMPEAVAAHESAIQKLAADTGDRHVPLRPKINRHGNEYLPSEHFTFNRLRNQKRISPDLALSPEEAREIFAKDPEEDQEPEARDVNNTHLVLAEPLPTETSDIEDSVDESQPEAPREVERRSDRGAFKSTYPRRSNPSGFRGGSSAVDEGEFKKDLIPGKRIYSPNLTKAEQEGGWTFAPRKEWILPTNVNRIRNSSAFLNSLDVDELALNAAQMEPGFTIEEFAAERGLGIRPARRFQTAFNKKRKAWEEAGGDPTLMPAPAAAEEEMAAP